MLRALNWLKSKFKLTEILELGKAALDAPEPSAFPAHLERMQLTEPGRIEGGIVPALTAHRPEGHRAITASKPLWSQPAGDGGACQS